MPPYKKIFFNERRDRPQKAVSFHSSACKIPWKTFLCWPLEILINMLSDRPNAAHKIRSKASAQITSIKVTQSVRTNKPINFYSPQRNTKIKQKREDPADNRSRMEQGGIHVGITPLEMMLIYGFRFDYSGANCKWRANNWTACSAMPRAMGICGRSRPPS